MLNILDTMMSTLIEYHEAPREIDQNQLKIDWNNLTKFKFVKFYKKDQQSDSKNYFKIIHKTFARVRYEIMATIFMSFFVNANLSKATNYVNIAIDLLRM